MACDLLWWQGRWEKGNDMARKWQGNTGAVWVAAQGESVHQGCEGSTRAPVLQCLCALNIDGQFV